MMLLAAGCSIPTIEPACADGEEQCGLDGPCFDPSSATCCGVFLDGGELCSSNETCRPTAPGSFDSSCQPDAWFAVACDLTAPTYRGSYDAQPIDEAIIGSPFAHDYELQFARGCGTIVGTTVTGHATVTFDGAAHATTWSATQTADSPLTFSGDATLGLVSIAITSADASGFRGDVTDANGTHAVTFTTR